MCRMCGIKKHNVMIVFSLTNVHKILYLTYRQTKSNFLTSCLVVYAAVYIQYTNTFRMPAIGILSVVAVSINKQLDNNNKPLLDYIRCALCQHGVYRDTTVTVDDTLSCKILSVTVA